MSTRILFPTRRKMLAYVLVALTLLLCFTVIGVGYSQPPSPAEAEKMKSIQIINGYVTNKTLPFINTRIHAKIQKKINTIFKEKRYLC